jgi:hypothetical protein
MRIAYKFLVRKVVRKEIYHLGDSGVSRIIFVYLFIYVKVK